MSYTSTAVLQDRVAIITGGAGGIGLETTKAMQQHGATVVISDINSARGETVAKELGIEFFPGDLTRSADVANLANYVLEQHGRIDIALNNVPVLTPEIRGRLWAYLGGIARQNGFEAKCVGGVADHVRLLLSLPTTIAISKAIQLMKGGSSIWIHQMFPKLRNLSWQQGYGAFSVGISQMRDTIRYIEQQEEHHRTLTFQEEYLRILKRHEMAFDERYLWN
jgi:putative transposase